MKNLLKLLFIFSALLVTHSATAFSSKITSEDCKTPRFNNFSLPEYNAKNKIEVAPESEFSFVISSKADSSTLKIIAKKKSLEYTIEKNSSFYKITGKIPAEYTGKFVRISAFVSAKLECKGKDGWLVKVSEAKAKPEIEAKPEAEIDGIETEEDCE